VLLDSLLKNSKLVRKIGFPELLLQFFLLVSISFILNLEHVGGKILKAINDRVSLPSKEGVRWVVAMLSSKISEYGSRLGKESSIMFKDGQLSELKLVGISLKLCEILSLESHILERNLSMVKEESDGFSSSVDVEVVKFD
jgi:hypothetical protein